LCDCLIVCDLHIIIISVKECAFRDTGNTTGWERWKKNAIEKSLSQIGGAQSWLSTQDRFQRADGRIVQLPPQNLRRYHRIAVALGANGQVPIHFGDQQDGFVHLCDERSLGAIFVSLDTITDFVEFLSETEALFASGTRIIFSGGGIEDLLALYLGWGESYKIPGRLDGAMPDMLILQNDLWTGLSSSESFHQRQKNLHVSYAWDDLIEHFTNDLLTAGIVDFLSEEVTNDQRALIQMAKQPRHHRAQLAAALIDYLSSDESAARVAVGYEGTAFVFIARERPDMEFRVKELTLRCEIVRVRCPGVTKVVGIGMDQPGFSQVGYASELVYLNRPEITDEDRTIILAMQEKLGYFKGVSWSQE
jgi:hypothetical protein